MAERDFDERTLAPTPRRREEARRRGDLPRSRDLMVALSLLAAFLTLSWIGPRVFAELCAFTREVLAAAGRAPALTAGLSGEALGSSRDLALALAPLALIVPAAFVLGAVVQGGLTFRLEAAAPRPSRLDPAAGLRRLCGGRALARAALAFIKLGAVAWVAVPFGTRLAAGQLGAEPLTAGAPWEFLAGEALDLGLRAALVLAALSGLDYALERWRFERELRMTPAEAREEVRRIEGDPEWKARRHKLRPRLLDQARSGGGA